MGWKALRGSNIYLNDGILSGKISEPKALIQSAPWLFTKSEGLSKITIKIKNSSYANHLKLSVYSRNMDQNFWQNATEPVDWSAQQWVSIPISSNDTEYKTYTIPISKFKKINKKLMQIAIQPAVNTYNGTWEIDEIIIE